MNVGAGLRQGEVRAFDEHVGLGQIGADAAEMVGFHCIAIADGSRRIEVGTAVRYRLVPGLHGRWEAADITPCADGSAAPTPGAAVEVEIETE